MFLKKGIRKKWQIIRRNSSLKDMITWCFLNRLNGFSEDCSPARAAGGRNRLFRIKQKKQMMFGEGCHYRLNTRWSPWRKHCIYHYSRHLHKYECKHPFRAPTDANIVQTIIWTKYSSLYFWYFYVGQNTQLSFTINLTVY